MARKHIKPPRLDLKIALDTSSLHTGSASYFLRKEVSDLIEANASQLDLTLQWIVPEVVRHERLYQMRQEAFRMLPAIERLVQLLGLNLNITEDILERRVEEAVDRQIKTLGLRVHHLDIGSVDWTRLIADASYRRPPFQTGEKEKGFRDALILEIFCQIINASPASRSLARIVLVSGDQLLRQAAQSRIRERTNVHLLESVEALKGLINTLGSTVDEDYIEKIKGFAASMFFVLDDKNTLWYKESIWDKLQKTLDGSKISLPVDAERYKRETWIVHNPRFAKKQGQRVYWTTRFEAKLTAVRTVESKPPVLPTGLTIGPMIGPGPLGLQAQPDLFTSGSLKIGELPPLSSHLGPLPPPKHWTTATLFPMTEDEAVRQGLVNLDVLWSVSVTTSGALAKPKVEQVTFVDVTWD